MVFPVPAWPERRMTPPTGKPPCNALSSRGIPVGERASAALDVAIPPSRLARFLNVSRGGAVGGGPRQAGNENGPRRPKNRKVSRGPCAQNLLKRGAPRRRHGIRMAQG